jgi:hypothetical protein
MTLIAVFATMPTMAADNSTLNVPDAQPTTADVADKLTAAVKDDQLNFLVSADVLGVPISSAQLRKLKIEYICGPERPKTRVFADGQTAVIRKQGPLTITNASYGVMPDPVDVTDAVGQAAALDDKGHETIKVDAQTLGIDPAPGKTKQLLVRYVIMFPPPKDVEYKVVIASDSTTLHIVKPANADDIGILEASYGIISRIDVTEIAYSYLHNNKLMLNIIPEIFADPAPGQQKELRVDYTVGGIHHSLSKKDGEPLIIPAASDGDGILQVVKAVYGLSPEKK